MSQVLSRDVEDREFSCKSLIVLASDAMKCTFQDQNVQKSHYLPTKLGNLIVRPVRTGLHDKNYFDGGKTYRVTLPKDAFMENSDPKPTVALIKNTLKIYPYTPGGLDGDAQSLRADPLRQAVQHSPRQRFPLL
jgi:hypothetical protein